MELTKEQSAFLAGGIASLDAILKSGTTAKVTMDEARALAIKMLIDTGIAARLDPVQVTFVDAWLNSMYFGNASAMTQAKARWAAGGTVNVAAGGLAAMLKAQSAPPTP